MDDEIKVTIYCVAYNHEKYIRDTLEGFVNQKTNFKYEVLINDDASTDNTAAIIREYEEKYPDLIIPFYQTENQYSKGNGDCKYIFNKFFEKVTRGKYVAYCEGDDYWCDENKLQLQYDMLESGKGYVASVHQTKRIQCITGEESDYSVCEGDTLDLETILMHWGNAGHMSSLMTTKEYYLERPEFTELLAGDFGIFIYIALTGSVSYINNTMSVYREYSGATSWSNKNQTGSERLKQLYDIRMKEMDAFEKADEYSGRKYHKIFEKAKADRYFAALDYKFNKKLLFDKYQKMILKQKSAKERRAILMNTYFPRLFKTLVGVKNRKR